MNYTVTTLAAARTPLRRFLIVSHRWLGLGSCVLLSVIGLTGTAFLIPAPKSVREVIEELHVNLMIPGVGRWIVIAATIAAVLLELSGLYLWWQRRSWSVRWRSGWRLASYDLHNLIGAVLFVIMLLLAGTALGRVAVRPVFPSSSVIVKGTNVLHTGLPFPAPIKVVYGIGGLGFLVQGLTGVVMWWPLRRRPSSGTGLPAGG